MNFKKVICCLLFCLVSCYAEIDFSSVVVDININGLHHLSESDLQNIQLKSVVGNKIKESFLLYDIQNLYLTGYFHNVSAETIPSRSNTVILQFNVEENPIIDHVYVHGNTQLESKKVLNTLYHQSGKIVNFNELENDKQHILDYFTNEGFDLFKITDIKFSSPNIEIYINEVVVERIEFKGLKTIKPFVIQRSMNLKPGDAFNSLVLRKDRERLLKLGYFSDISFPKLIKGSSDNSVIVELDFNEKKSNRIDIGLEQEEQQFVGFVKLLKNHAFMHSDLLSGKVQIGNLDNNQLGLNSYSTTYYQPWFLNRFQTEFQLRLFNDITQELLSTNLSNNTDTELASRKGYAFSFGKDIIQDHLTYRIGFKNEFVESVNTSEVSPYLLNSLIYELSYTSVNSLFNPNKGGYWNWTYEQGGNKSPIDFTGLAFSKTNINAAYFFELMSNLTLGVHSSFGLFDTSESTVTYETESFVIGGASTLRGYKDTDFRFSGSRKILFNSELRYNLSSTYQVILFYDRGNTFDSNSYSLSDMHDGKGIGVRFFTPVGPIRLDLAYGDLWYLHFGIGQLF